MADPTRIKCEFKDDSSETEQRVRHIAGLTLDFTRRWGPKAILDLGIFNDRLQLGRAFSLALSEMCAPGGEINRWLTARRYGQSLKNDFHRFLLEDEQNGQSRVSKPQDLTTDLLERYYAWLKNKELSLDSLSKRYGNVKCPIEHLKGRHPELISFDLHIPRGRERNSHHSSSSREPYSDLEVKEFEVAAREAVRKSIYRLTKEIEDLLVNGKDPDTVNDGWRSKENALWYVDSKLGRRYISGNEMKKSGHNKLNNCLRLSEYTYSRREIYSYFYPSVDDLAPLISLLALKTGFNPQVILDLKRDCLRDSPEKKRIEVNFTKYRNGEKPLVTRQSFPNRSEFDPGGIIRSVLKITEPILPFVSEADRNYLWLFLLTKGNDVGFHRLSSYVTLAQVTNRFSRTSNLTDDDGNSLSLNVSRMRPTRLTKRYKASGNLALVSKSARHASKSTTIPYIDNVATRHLHEQTTSEGIQDFYDAVKGRVLIQSPEDEAQIEQAANELAVTAERASGILRGEQDVFVAACKDFYNRPGGKPNTPCDRPFACFTCKNACWTSSTLPRLIRFKDFVTTQREFLTAEDWEGKFGHAYRITTEVILPAFPPEVVALAAVAAPSEPFYLPVSMKTL